MLPDLFLYLSEINTYTFELLLFPLQDYEDPDHGYNYPAAIRIPLQARINLLLLGKPVNWLDTLLDHRVNDTA